MSDCVLDYSSTYLCRSIDNKGTTIPLVVPNLLKATYLHAVDFFYSQMTQNLFSTYIENPVDSRISRSLDIIPLNDLGTTKYIVKKPFLLLVSQDDGEYKIEFSELELYSFAEDKDEAVDELKEDIIDLCDTILSMNDSQLATNPKKWKKILNEYIFENE